MSIKNNKSVMEKFVEFINNANEKLAGDLISEDAIFYAPTSPEPLKGTKGYMLILNMMRSSFPDISWKLEEMVAENESIAARFTMTGTHQGAFFNIPPTGKTFKINVMNFYRFSNNKIIEEYGQPDIFGLLQQLK